MLVLLVCIWADADFGSIQSRETCLLLLNSRRVRKFCSSVKHRQNTRERARPFLGARPCAGYRLSPLGSHLPCLLRKQGEIGEGGALGLSHSGLMLSLLGECLVLAAF